MFKLHWTKCSKNVLGVSSLSSAKFNAVAIQYGFLEKKRMLINVISGAVKKQTKHNKKKELLLESK